MDQVIMEASSISDNCVDFQQGDLTDDEISQKVDSILDSELDNTVFLRQIDTIEEDRPDFEETGRIYYKSQCRKLNIVPCDIYLRSIETETLRLSHYGLRANGILPMSNSLVYNKTISKIDLTDNWLCDLGVAHLMAMIKLNQVITELNLSHNQLTNACAQTLTETLANSAILARLDLSHNLFDDGSATCFGELMILSLRLEYLNLSYNIFGTKSVVPFGKAFLQTTSISHLDLSFNSLGGTKEMVQKFTKGLMKNECFKILDLSSNAFSSKDDAISFAKVLKSNTTLEELNLNNNRINTEAVVSLAKGLTDCKSLKILRIGRNPILSAGCFAIVTCILKNDTPPFKVLDFESIDVNEDFKVLADKLLRHIPDIIILTGVRLIVRICSNIDPIVRLKILMTKKDISVVSFFKRYAAREEDTFLKLDDIPDIIIAFCDEYQFNLLDSDKRRWYKLFPRNESRTVKFYQIAMMLDEYYVKEPSEQEEEGKDEGHGVVETILLTQLSL